MGRRAATWLRAILLGAGALGALAIGCGGERAASGPDRDAGAEVGAGADDAAAATDAAADTPAAADTAGATGGVRVTWTLRTAAGAPTDCLVVDTPLVRAVVRARGGSETAADTTFYCVDGRATLGGIPPGAYTLELRLLDATNAPLATVQLDVTVMAGADADAGAATFAL